MSLAEALPKSFEDQQIDRVCPHCDSSVFHDMPDYSKPEWWVGACGDCGFVYLKNVPIYDRMIEEFAWEKTWSDERERRFSQRPASSKASMIWRKIRKPFRKSEHDMFGRLFKPGAVLDVGCGLGNRIPQKFVPFGIELSLGLNRAANAQMKPRGGHCVHAPAVEGIEQFEAGFFTGIILRSFLEHEWQPRELLSGAHRVLRNDGRIFVRVPNFASLNRKARGAEWCGFRWPDHVNYFTPESLGALARECGFAMQLLNPVKISIDDNIKAVLTKRTA
ncbi:MAG: class I SAM-dependent methyltransferase [Ahrensia sp.]|nr:class I SAM-dependent methyltransferase [Ahrensia sp.]